MRAFDMFNLPVFKDVHDKRVQAHKVLEEASELCETAKRYDRCVGESKFVRMEMIDEFADVIQTLVNFAECFGVTDDELMHSCRRCYDRNYERERYAAIIDADGVPFEDGDIVYDDDSTEYKVGGKMLATRKVFVEKVDGWSSWIEADKLTHRKPEPLDSWERIEEDIIMGACECTPTIHCHSCKECEENFARDITRRCRALAEKEAGR